MIMSIASVAEWGIWLAALGLILPMAALAQVPPPMEEPEGHRGDLLAELAEVEGLLGEKPGDAELGHRHAELLYEAGEFARAREAIARILADGEPSIEAQRLGAELAYLSGRYDEAEELLGRILAREPDDRRALRKLVLVCFQTGRYEKCPELPEDQGMPHADLMRSFGEDTPYRIEWGAKDETVVPFLLTDPLPVLTVTIEGREVTTLLDTGGDTFILDPEIAASLGIEVVASMEGMFAGGMTAEVGFGRAESLVMGDVTVRSVPLALLPTQGFVLGEHTIEGILGTNVLRQFLATVDYPNDRLILRKRGGEAASRFYDDSRSSVVAEVPFVVASTHFLMARGSLNGVDGLVFHVDSGLAGEPAFSAPRQTLEYVGIPIPETAVQEDTVGGGGGGWASGTFDVATLGLGSLTRRDLIGSYGALPPQTYRMLGFIQDGLLSHQFLRHYGWTIDFDRMAMVFTQ
jgi:hypothetical protein